MIEADRAPIRARATRFDLSATPLHWVPGDPQTTHTINVLHVLLPPGERWFCDVFRDALPLVTDPQLRDDVRGFVGQEATHAKAHTYGLDHLAAHGIDVRSPVERADRLRGRLRRRAQRLPRWAQRRILVAELAAIAAIEHFTAVLGTWVVESPGLDEAGADPVMLDLLRWHGSEEVEHRAVAFDLYQHVSGNYPRRVLAMGLAFVGLSTSWVVLTHLLMRLDPTTTARPTRRQFQRAVQQGRHPSFGDIVQSIPRYLRRDHHPSQVGSTEQALAYLAQSPGVVARR